MGGIPNLLQQFQQATAVADERRQQEGTRGSIFNVGAVRENPGLLQFPMYSGYKGLDPTQLAMVDRYTHGAGMAENLPQARLGPIDPIGLGGALGAGVGGVGAEMAKLLGREDVAGWLAKLISNPAQAESLTPDESTSEPSMYNILALLRGYADARWGD